MANDNCPEPKSDQSAANPNNEATPTYSSVSKINI
jgi:hypothetical protein